MLLNYSELARDAGISVDSARRYMEYLRLSCQTFLLLETPAGIISMEIKSRATAHTKDTRAMRTVVQQLGKKWLGGLVIHTGKAIKPLAEPDIWAVPSHRLFQPPGFPL